MKRASLRSFCLASLFVVGTTIAACGTDTTGLFASGGQGAGASGGAGGQGGAGNGGAGQGGAGNGGAGQGGAGNGGSGQGGAGNGGAGQGGAGNGPSSSSSSTQSSSSGPMPPVVMVACGDVVCPVSGQSACCWDDSNYNDPPQGECVSGPDDNDNCATEFGGNGQPGFESRIECQLPEHCPAGTVCCGDLTQTQGGNWYPLLRCAATCTYPQQRVICDPQAPDTDCPVIQTGQGPVQMTCQPSTILPDGYNICRP
ncbi:hypothetical protein [Polyangium sorediatum]|uniref:PE-PGRS family protein n=1 Tax=Polyangium sorediatum TaxID=889274 RepID=A0ABT6P3T6_9BACT|nr:hypothetical protein [Polyangium sorediatum]MDI1435269.1 hypothetical protein [Polyangium sorediatum]